MVTTILHIASPTEKGFCWSSGAWSQDYFTLKHQFNGKEQFLDIREDIEGSSFALIKRSI